METGKRTIHEKVDIKLKELKKRYNEGIESPDLYNLKVRNLNLVKEVANTGITKEQGLKEWKHQKD